MSNYLSDFYVNSNGLYVNMAYSPDIRPYNTNSTAANIPIGSYNLPLVQYAQVDINWAGYSNQILVDPDQTTVGSALTKENTILTNFCNQVGGSLSGFSGGVDCTLPSSKVSPNTLTQNVEQALGLPSS
jgi:hypothetical protein